jgi:GntR family transcriptional repressor for pyruvate dehydrogenase complex
MPLAFQPIRTPRTFEQVIAQITDAIATGALRPGDSLPSERALAAEMDVSRRTIREAARTLADVGVLTIQPPPRGGMVVRTEIVPAELTHLVETRESEISDVLETRRLIEPRVAQLAGVYAEREDFDELARTIELQQPDSDRETYLALESRFHLTMARASRNTVVYRLMKDLIGRVILAADISYRGSPNAVEAARDIHERTLAALKTRDPAVIAVVMDEHLRFLEDRWEAQGGRLRYRAVPTFLISEDRAQPSL